MADASRGRQGEEYLFELSGGRLCLDFANTVSGSRTVRPTERLRSYGDLVSWSRQAGVVTDGQAERLLRQAGRRPSDAAAVLERAVALREAIYRVFSAVAAGRAPGPADLAGLNEALAGALARSRLVPAGGRFAWSWADDEAALDPMLGPVTRSAADLLTSDDLGLVRECASDDCTWLFMDTSRNRSRRWCDMRSCGNRAKARRHRERRRTDG